MTAAAPSNSNSSRGLDRPQPVTFSTLPRLTVSLRQEEEGIERQRAWGSGLKISIKRQRYVWGRDGVPMTQGEIEVKRDEDGEQRRPRLGTPDRWKRDSDKDRDP